jgi:tRNA nucleotidyltransferase/poly(A) polymerase
MEAAFPRVKSVPKQTRRDARSTRSIDGRVNATPSRRHGQRSLTFRRITVARIGSSPVVRRTAGAQEIELKRLFTVLLPGSHFAHKVFAVGGYVRDELLGKEPADLDVAVELPYGAQRLAGFLQDQFPEIVAAPLGLDYPIWHVSFPRDVRYADQVFRVGGAELDLTDTQALVQAWDGSESTEFGPLAEDVKRRDFTTNMLYEDLTSGEILDPTGRGKTDLEGGVLRTRPDADIVKVLSENPRVMLRLVRFMVQYDWKPDPELEAALVEAVPRLVDMTEHGLKKEFHKLQVRGILEPALKVMRHYEMLEPLRTAWRKAKEKA